jgi:crotonobetainyl-CoA:carnitine CoA-transferase CaiB-like acyl-CoA transferase
LHAAFAALAALEGRDATGEGMQVETTMIEAALNVAAEPLLEASANGRVLSRDGNRGPGASPQGVYRCAGGDAWLALAALDDLSWRGLAETVGRPDLASRTDLLSEEGRRRSAGELDTAITSWATDVEAEDAAARLRAAGVAAARVGLPDDLLTDPQLITRGFWRTVNHPVIGQHVAPGLPFRSAAAAGPGEELPAPTLGQHNEEVLTGLLGLTPDDLRTLTEQGVIGTRPAGLR